MGKSIRIRTRLLSYFRADARTRGDGRDGRDRRDQREKAARIVADAARVEWTYVPNEFAALVTEMRLIQRQRPRYNVQHKRKVRYAFVKITREPAPRVLPVTRVVGDGSTYFGPFPRVRRVADTVRELTYVLGLRDCPSTVPMFFGDQTELFGGGGNGGGGNGSPLARSPRCLRGDLGTCCAPCCGRVTSEDYGARVEHARRFLQGRGRAPLDILGERMAAAVRATDFEYAGVLRDRQARLRAFQEELAAFRGEVESLTFLYRVPGFKGNDRLYFIRRGRIAADLPHPKSSEARREVAARVREEWARPDPGPAGLSAREAAETLLVARWFRQNPKELKKRTRPVEEWLAGKPLSRRSRPSP